LGRPETEGNPALPVHRGFYRRLNVCRVKSVDGDFLAMRGTFEKIGQDGGIERAQMESQSPNRFFTKRTQLATAESLVMERIGASASGAQTAFERSGAKEWLHSD
jgi:hypothetical protein